MNARNTDDIDVLSELSAFLIVLQKIAMKLEAQKLFCPSLTLQSIAKA
jgi:hypothetical protein